MFSFGNKSILTSKIMIAIVDYGMGNLGSIQNMLKKIGSSSKITSDPVQISEASKIILPGVGAFDRAMNKINCSGLREVLNREVIINKKITLGICLGMQLMTNKSEEGELEGLNWIEGECKRFNLIDLPVPHMGWNFVDVVQNGTKISNHLDRKSKFYFVHSYFVNLNNKSHELFQTNYGISFCSGFQYQNIIGVQFHPEKSHKFGIQFLTNFLAL